MRNSAENRLLRIVFLTLVLALAATAAQAHSSGISGYSINGCNSCHAGSPLPTSVTITGPTTVTSGSTNSYTLTITGGAAVVGGLDVSHSVGTFVVNDSGTKLLSNEITHNAPRSFTGSAVSWTFNWTAPTVTTNTSATLYGSGLSADGDGSTSGDGSLSTTLGITVTADAATAPSITTQPASQTVTAGQTATFTVIAAGTAPLSYQWTKNGATISGATAASYTTPATTTADSGSTFAVTVTNSTGSVTSSSATLTVNAAGTAQVPASSHVFLLVEENHAYSSIIGSALMPYLNSLANTYGLATQYYADAHPSISDYFMLTTGQTISADDTQTPATLPVSADNIVRELMTSGKTWKAYVEDLPSVGYTGGSSGNYLASSNPFAFFTDVNNSASQKLNLVPFSQFATDLAANQLPNFSFLKPNILNDGNNGTLDTADLWLQNNIAPLLASSAFQQDGILILTFDESVDSDTAHGGGQVATVVIGPKVISGTKATTLYQHENVLRTLLTALDVTTFPGAAATATPMAEFFSSSVNTLPPPLPPPMATPPKPFLVSAPATATGTRGTPFAVNVTIAPQNGFNGPVTLSCSGLPSNATFSWSANPVTPQNGSVSSTLTITVPPAAASAAPLQRRPSRPLLALSLPLFGVVFGPVMLGGKQKRRALWIVLGLVLLMLLLGTACGTSSSSHTTTPTSAGAQSFTVTITAASGTTTATSNVVVTLN
jgi:acid phosphatase